MVWGRGEKNFSKGFSPSPTPPNPFFPNFLCERIGSGDTTNAPV